MGYIIAILIFAMAFVGYGYYRKQTQEKLKLALPPHLATASVFLKKYLLFLNNNQYLSNYQVFKLKEPYQELARYFHSVRYKKLPNFENEIGLIDQFLSTFDTAEKEVDHHNELFIAREIIELESFFGNIEGKSLDDQQRQAVVVNQDNNLIIAGAGSGKTLTIAAKVKYLIERCGYKEEEILLISFTRKAAEEMYDRINKKMGINLPVMTFHKLGLQIIAEATGEKPSIFDASKEKIRSKLLSFVLSDYNNNLMELLDFFIYGLKPYKPNDEFESDKEYQDYMMNQRLVGLRVITPNKNPSLAYREEFKSQEEVIIANFLFQHQINYEYEEKYQYKTASKKFGQYKPDFYLPDYDIYIEHFALDEKGQVPPWFSDYEEVSAQQRYTEGIKWKRNEHDLNDTTLVETYSWQQKQGVLLDTLRGNLESHGVVFKPMSEDSLWNYLNAQPTTSRDLETFLDLIHNFLILFKANNANLKELARRAKKSGDTRTQKFLTIFKPILKKYNHFLQQEGEIDFSDMITTATSLVKERGYKSPYKYIFVDEYQDISNGRFGLIKALLNNAPQTKLFCVGDDWQSIFRFTGSNINLFTKFEEIFSSSPIKAYKRKTFQSFIETTYRFNQKMIATSSSFILKNPNQIKKNLRSNDSALEDPISFWYHDGSQSGQGRQLDLILQDISLRSVRKPTSVLMLGRYKHNEAIISTTSVLNKPYQKGQNQGEYSLLQHPHIRISFLTVHGSKGLEADYVVILTGKAGLHGFPSEVVDDSLLSFLLTQSDQYPNAEERRLYYVAMTRAKRHVYQLVEAKQPSKFVEELKEKEPDNLEGCPWCDNGRLVLKTGKYGHFLACNNRSSYCTYTRSARPKELAR